jgi:hypothetical protein
MPDPVHLPVGDLKEAAITDTLGLFFFLFFFFFL